MEDFGDFLATLVADLGDFCRNSMNNSAILR